MSEKMSWFSLESIKLWGVPIEVDGTSLQLHQAKVLVGIVEELMDDAKFSKPDAIKYALPAFKKMYEKHGSEWRAKKTIKLKGHGGAVVRSKYHGADMRERLMARVKAEVIEKRVRAKLVKALVLEAGQRNSGKDKTAVIGALGSLFDVLNSTDQETVLKALGKKVGKKIKFRRPE